MYFCKAKMTWTDFILQHAQDDPVRLLLSRDKYPDIDLDLAVTTLEVRKKLRTKVPEWYAVPSLVYPFRLSGEQCSSTETSRYKAILAMRLPREGIPSETVAPRPLPHRIAAIRPKASFLPSAPILRAPPSYAAEGGHRFQRICPPRAGSRI